MMIKRSQGGGISPYQLAIIYSGLGDKDRAFQRLEEAYQEHSGWLTLVAAEPLSDSLRSDPRFAELVRRVGLPH